MKIYMSILILLNLVACGSNTVFDLDYQSKSIPGVTYNNKIDILWVVDSSGTMKGNRDKLASNIGYMFQILDSKKLDYRMAAVTTDMSELGDEAYRGGRFVGSTKVIDSKSSNKAEKFSSMLNVPETQSSRERGRDAVKTALSAVNLATINQGFLRSDALLVLIFVSDEDDQSINSTLESFASELTSLKPSISENKLGWMANFVGVIDSMCERSDINSAMGSEYMSLVDLSLGSSSSICEGDLSLAIDNIQRRIVSVVSSIELKFKPLIETIVVKFDGVLVPQDANNGWTYEESINSIVFHGSAIPASDVLIDVVSKPRDLTEN